ncbi:MAG: NAD(P)H-dependent oxidoreductase subunit E [Verrucomicrobia bacterium]|nr:NAD(P)H-dependent oxidoreductase subunit E [Verrucomicrobiota bacterium]
MTKDDSRIKRLQSVINRHQKRPDALIEILHGVQDSYGYVPLSLMAFIAQELKVPASRIYGVVTFYHFFSTKPRGEHTCVICTGTACHVRGAQVILDAIHDDYKIRPGEQTPDGKLGLQMARCLGCCSLGPVAVFDNDIIPKTDAKRLLAILHEKI